MENEARERGRYMLIFEDWMPPLRAIPKDELYDFFQFLMDYQNAPEEKRSEVSPHLDERVSLLWLGLKPAVDASCSKRDRRKAAGRKGGIRSGRTRKAKGAEAVDGGSSGRDVQSGQRPSLEDVLKLCPAVGCTESFAREFCARMDSQGWQYMKGRAVVEVCKENLRPVLGAWWQNEQQHESRRGESVQHRAEAPAGAEGVAAALADFLPGGAA